jgi:transketolase
LGEAREAQWNRSFASYSAAYPQQAAELRRRLAGELPRSYSDSLQTALNTAATKRESIATRKASQLALEALAPTLPELIGGSADLTGSNLTKWSATSALRPDALGGRHIHFGVREFGMGAIANGIALHGGYIPFVGTFLVFSDYARNAVRMSALMRQRVVYVFTHDSIGLGEDGPTHQAVEHTASLRLIPFLDVWRPADPVETLVAWASVLERRDGPGALLLSRQSVPYQAGARDAEQIRRGAYVLAEANGSAQAVLIATGSELPLAVEAQKVLQQSGIAVRVVSMPSTSVFDRQPVDYKSSVLPDGLPRIAIEAGVTDFWWKYVRAEGAVIGIDRFGESAPAADLFKHFGFTVDNVVATVNSVLAKGKT